MEMTKSINRVLRSIKFNFDNWSVEFALWHKSKVNTTPINDTKENETDKNYWYYNEWCQCIVGLGSMLLADLFLFSITNLQKWLINTFYIGVTPNLLGISERPISQKRGSAEPNRFGQFDRRFGRTVRPNFSHFWPIFWSNVWSKIDQHTNIY